MNENRCVIAASIDNGRPVAFLDDGSVYRLDSEGQWQPLRPVPTTEADNARKAK